MQRGLFVTGTDTGVGKTVVTCLLTRALRQQGRAVRVCKPVATGATREGGLLVSDDTRLLAQAADDPALGEITPWVFAEPAAPPVAARQAGVTLSLEAIADAVRRREMAGTTLLVEGVGGLLCPLTEDSLVADLASELGLPLLIVARRSLGTLNHTLLTVEAARTRRLAVAGVVINETTPVEGLAEKTNVEELCRRLPVPVLAVVPHGAATDPEGWRILTELSCKR
jgi:dethiobiotin synthetase